MFAISTASLVPRLDPMVFPPFDCEIALSTCASLTQVLKIRAFNPAGQIQEMQVRGQYPRLMSSHGIGYDQHADT